MARILLVMSGAPYRRSAGRMFWRWRSTRPPVVPRVCIETPLAATRWSAVEMGPDRRVHPVGVLGVPGNRVHRGALKGSTVGGVRHVQGGELVEKLLTSLCEDVTVCDLDPVDVFHLGCSLGPLGLPQAPSGHHPGPAPPGEAHRANQRVRRAGTARHSRRFAVGPHPSTVPPRLVPRGALPVSERRRAQRAGLAHPPSRSLLQCWWSPAPCLSSSFTLVRSTVPSDTRTAGPSAGR